MKFINFPEISTKTEGMEDVRIPRMIKIRQLYDKYRIKNIPRQIHEQMRNNLSERERYFGKKICITAGSRGIPDLDIIIKTVIDQLIEWGAEPFIVPAMGSHGGATAEGQSEILATYNITEKSMGVPIRSSMDVTQVGILKDNTPVFCDKHACNSDGIVVLNKIKPHTDFRARNESGLAKMMAIGLGKHIGASQFHMKGFASFAERIPEVCNVLLEKVPIAFGVGVVQNAYDEISCIEIMEKDHILKKDAKLLEVAKTSIPHFKFKDIDVLIIDEIGKNISGNGADPNITGRSNNPGFENILNLKRLFIRSLNKETHHNGCGLNLADITTRRCLNSVDFETTWINCITGTMPEGGRIPMYQENDRDALMLAIRTCNGIDFKNADVVRIKDTLSMEYIQVSESYHEACKNNPDIEILSEPFEIEFDEEGFMK